MSHDRRSGYVKLHRTLLNHPAFRNVQEAMCFAWWIMLARWRPETERIDGHIVHLDRGDLPMSKRFLAMKFGWSESKAHRFIQRMIRENMVIKKRTTPRTSNRATPTTVLTICNYDKYQSSIEAFEPPCEPPSGPGPDQDRTTTGPTTNKLKKSKNSNDYAFSGKVVRLIQRDFDQWRESYPGIVDLRGWLQNRDDYLATRPEPEQRDWFHSTSRQLQKENEAIARAVATAEANEQARHFAPL